MPLPCIAFEKKLSQEIFHGWKCLVDGNVSGQEISWDGLISGRTCLRAELVQVLQRWTCPICDERRIGKNLNEV